ALIEALREKKIAGAALDVFHAEPIYKKHPFVTELDNIVITPHLAGATYDAIDNHSVMIVEDIKKFLKGERMLYQYK
ncbi:MAG: NAD(P)-dependent oxidoreductase, partial [Clostridium sp.]|nr:NAD(P)-dependent oxidoreductase [Clostridium sp.]